MGRIARTICLRLTTQPQRERRQKMNPCLIGVGSNLGDRQRNVSTAVERLAEHPQIELTATSGWLCSEPVGGPAGQGEFVNGVCAIETNLTPRELLGQLLAVERSLGRSREQRWAPRTIDLDLLMYDQTVLVEDDLQLPHPWMTIRRFVMGPAAEIAAHWQHPTTGWTIGQLHQHLVSSPQRALVVSSTADLGQRVLCDAGFAVVTPAAAVAGPATAATSPQTMDLLTYAPNDNADQPAAGDYAAWEITLLPCADQLEQPAQWHAALSAAPEGRLKVALINTPHHGWLAAAVHASGGPCLTINCHSGLARVAHDFRAALEGTC